MDLTESTLTPEQMIELEMRGTCPYWQRVNVRGSCVNKWWAGGPVSRMVDGLAVVMGMALLGFIVTEASKYRPFRPAIDRLKASREEAKFIMNPKPRRRARRVRRRRR